MGGYALAKFNFKGQGLFFGIVILSMVIPDFATYIPFFKIMIFFGWINTPWGLIFPGIANGLGVFLMRQYIKSTLHNDLIDAAKIDGMGNMGILLRIVMPICKPAIAILAIKTFVESWNEFQRPLFLLTRFENMTLPLALQALIGMSGFTGTIGLMVGILPLLILYIFLSRQIIDGISMGSIKY